MLRYQCTNDAPLPGRIRKELCGALGKPMQAYAVISRIPFNHSFLEMLEERAPARLILLHPLANAENLPITALVHADRNQQRDVAHLGSPAELSKMPSR